MASALSLAGALTGLLVVAVPTVQFVVNVAFRMLGL